MANKPKQAAREIAEKLWRKNNNFEPANRVAVIFNANKRGANWNGFLFEALIHELLISAKIPSDCIFQNQGLALIPDTRYDFVLCHTDKKTLNQTPICLSLKTSLRERYKQADREGMIAKQVHRGSVTALLTMDTEQVTRIRHYLYGLDYIVDCNDASELSDFIGKIKTYKHIPYSEIVAIGPLVSKLPKKSKTAS